MSQSMARAAIDHCEDAFLDSSDDIIHLLQDEDLPVAAICAPAPPWDDIPGADLIIFGDGTGFFAGQGEPQADYMPWPLDPASGDPEVEFLPVLAETSCLSKLLGRSTKLDGVLQSSPDLTRHLRRCLVEHPDPPEAMRSLSWPHSQIFEWSDAGGYRRGDRHARDCRPDSRSRRTGNHHYIRPAPWPFPRPGKPGSSDPRAAGR